MTWFRVFAFSDILSFVITSLGEEGTGRLTSRLAVCSGCECFSSLPLHYENTPIQIYRKFHLQKLKIFR